MSSSRAALSLLAFFSVSCGGGTDGTQETTTLLNAPTSPTHAEPEFSYTCTDELEASLAYHWYPAVLVEAWTGEPFRFAIHPDVYPASLALGPNWYRDQIVGPINRMVERIEEQLGYPVVARVGESGAEPAIRIELWDGQYARDHLPVYCEDWPDFRTGMGALRQYPLVVFHEHFFNPENQCSSALRGRRVDNVIHEIVHLFGGEHEGEDTTRKSIDGRQTGWEMSNSLTWLRPDDSELQLTETDIARIGCVFPEITK